MERESNGLALAIGALVICGGVVGCAAHDSAKGHETHRMAPPAANTALPEIEPSEARKLLEGDGGYIYLDVRTPQEFEGGRPKGAINVPVLFMNAETGERAPNDDFVAVVEANIPKDAKIIVGCRSGGRSAMAQKLLYDAGYSHTYNMLGGFSGRKDASGTVLHQGWCKLGYPVETGAAGASEYDALKKKANLQ